MVEPRYNRSGWHLVRLVALRHLKLAPLRSALTLFGVAIAVSAIVAIGAANRAVIESFRGTVQSLSGKVDIEVGDGDSPIDLAFLDKVLEVKGVAHATPVVQARVRDYERKETITVIGLDLTGDDYFREFVSADFDPIEFLNCANCLMVSDRFAKERKLERNQDLQLNTPVGKRTFKIKAIVKDEGAMRAYEGLVAVMYIDAAQIVLDRQDLVDRIDVALAPGFTRDDVEARIRAAVGPGIAVERPERRGDRTENMMQRFRTALGMLSSVAALVAMFMIYNTVGIAVAQRRREMGVLRALGVERSAVRRLMIAEAMFLGFIGSLLGVVVGQLLAHAVVRGIGKTINSLYVQMNVDHAEVTPTLALIGVASGLVATFLSAYLPANEASKAEPAMSMQRQQAPTPPGVSWRVGLGITIFFATVSIIASQLEQFAPMNGHVAMLCILVAASGLSPLGLLAIGTLSRRPFGFLFGPPGSIAAANLLRQGTRAVVTVCALLVGIGLSTGSAAFTNAFQVSISDWIEQTVPADLFINGGERMSEQKSVRLPASMADELRSLPGHDGVEAVRLRKFNLGERRVTLTAIDFEVRLQFAKVLMLEGKAPESSVMTASRRLLVSENLSRLEHIHPGDKLQLNTPSGQQTYEVMGVYIDYTSDTGTLLIDNHWFGQDFRDTTVDTYEVYTKDKSQIEGLRVAIEKKLGDRYDLLIMTNREFKSNVREIVDSSFRATSAMSILAVLVALLGVVNTLFAAVLDRTREIGVLRAIGLTARQVVGTFVLEALLLSLAAGILGVIAGTFFGLMFVEVVNVQGTGWYVSFHPPWVYELELFCLSLGAAVLAAVWPAARSSRQRIVEALAYE